jgi:hypothetical protein
MGFQGSVFLQIAVKTETNGILFALRYGSRTEKEMAIS